MADDKRKRTQDEPGTPSVADAAEAAGPSADAPDAAGRADVAAEAGTPAPDPGAPGADPSAPSAGQADDEGPHLSDDDLSRLIASVNAAAAQAGTAPAASGGDVPMSDEQRVAVLEAELAERTDDLQRLQAEYVNYKRRVDRDRMLGRQQGAASVIRELVPVLDAVAHAEQAEGELPEGLRVVAAELTRVTAKLGLVQFGAPGDEFDPVLHEALYQVPTAEVPPMTVAQVVQPGYKLNDAVIRPARVAVAIEPA